MKRHLKFFRVAEAIAKTSEHKRARIGAAIVKKNTVVAVGANINKSHPMQKKYNKNRGFCVDIRNTLHAEMAALLRTTEDLHGATLYVYRKDRTGQLANCKPCLACAAYAHSRGIRKVHYTTPEGYMYEEWI